MSVVFANGFCQKKALSLSFECLDVKIKIHCRYIILGVVEMFLATVGDVPWDWGIDNNLFSILFC